MSDRDTKEIDGSEAFGPMRSEGFDFKKHYELLMRSYKNALFKIDEQDKRITELENENSLLAAGQCIHDLIGDEYGHFECSRVTELEAQNRAMMAAITKANELYPNICVLAEGVNAVVTPPE